MKYNVPYGRADETTLYSVPYINGNPTTGTMGSIPPAASIEHDQREIVDVIQYAYDHGYRDRDGILCASPSSLDLTQLRKAIWGFINADKLALNLTYYVNNIGSDSNDGLTAQTAFKTIQKAVDMSQKYDPNGFTITIYVADGTYDGFVCGAGNLKGWGTVYIIGNLTTPAACLISAATRGAAIYFTGNSRMYWVGGFKVTNPGAPPMYGHGVIAANNATLIVYNMDLGICTQIHLWASSASIILAGLLDKVPNVSFPFLRVSGGAMWHMRSSEGGAIGSHAPDLIITASISFSSGWTIADNLSHQVSVGEPFGSQPNFYNSITGKANVTGGLRYAATLNSIINTNGSGATYFPGTVAGTFNTGGQYV